MSFGLRDAADHLPDCYRLLFDGNPQPMCVYDTDNLRLLAANKAAASHWGYSVAELLELTVPDLYAADDLRALREHLTRLADAPPDGHPATHLGRHRRGDGALVEVETVTSAVDTGSGHARLMLIRDLTEQQLNALRLTEERDTLAAVINSTQDAVLGVDARGLIQSANPGAERVFGRGAASLLGRAVEVLLPPRFRAAHVQHRDHFIASEVRSRMMGLGLVKGLRADGQELDLEGTIAKVTVLQQPRLLIMLRDVTTRVRADAEVEQTRKQLSELTHRLMLQKKSLVKHLAQSLHDQLGQTLAAIRMAHETVVAMQSATFTPEADRIHAHLGMLIDQSIRQVRQVLIELRPPLLDEQGLASALDNELRNRALALPRIDFSIDVAPHVAQLRWPPEVEYAAFMVAREAVENALRHSGSDTVQVSLSGGPSSVELEVADQGCGMPKQATRRDGHLGILGMRERASAVGATVTMDANLPQGTRVRLLWQSAR